MLVCFGSVRFCLSCQTVCQWVAAHCCFMSDTHTHTQTYICSMYVMLVSVRVGFHRIVNVSHHRTPVLHRVTQCNLEGRGAIPQGTALHTVATLCPVSKSRQAVSGNKVVQGHLVPKWRILGALRPFIQLTSWHDSWTHGKLLFIAKWKPQTEESVEQI